MTSGYGTFFISIDWMPILLPTLDDADPLFALRVTPGFNLHRVEVTDQDSASGSLYDATSAAISLIYSNCSALILCFDTL